MLNQLVKNSDNPVAAVMTFFCSILKLKQKLIRISDTLLVLLTFCDMKSVINTTDAGCSVVVVVLFQLSSTCRL